MNSIVTATDVRRRYGEGDAAVDALAGVSVAFERGRFSAIMGPSGSGKSTLMHILAGLDRPTSGSVVLDGVEISDLDDGDLTKLRRDKLGFIFQFFNLIPVLTAEENAEFILMLRRVPKPQRRRQVDALFAQLGIDGLQGRKPNDLSGGQQQRVAIARAMAAEPAVILADEPTANLDSQTAEELLELMGRLNKNSGVTFIFSSHDPLVISRARRVVQLKDGRLHSDFSPALPV
jgi:putative ABC transport system ATP-binding protein